MQLSQKQIGHLAIFVAVCIFAFNTPLSKFLVTGHIYPLGLSAARIAFGCIIFWIVSFFSKKEKIAPKDHLILALGGITGYACNFGFYTYGLSMTSPIDASIITTSSPIFTMIIAAIILKEPITRLKVGGIIVGVAGAVILILSTEQNPTGKGGNITGDLIAMASSLCFAFYLVITKPITSKYGTFTIMKWMLTYAAIVFLPFTFHYLWEAPLFREEGHRALFWLAYPLIGCTFFAYILIVAAQRRIRATTISMYNNLQPVIVSAAVIVMNEGKLTPQKVGAACLVLCGVYLVTKSKSRRDIEKVEK